VVNAQLTAAHPLLIETKSIPTTTELTDEIAIVSSFLQGFGPTKWTIFFHACDYGMGAY
jgi:hypothetical protein